MVLTPPPVANKSFPVTGIVPLSFHTISGIGPSADELSGLFAAAQKPPAPSLNSVPPTATLFGVELIPETAWMVPVRAVSASHPAAPLSQIGRASCRERV